MPNINLSDIDTYYISDDVPFDDKKYVHSLSGHWIIFAEQYF